MFVKITRVRRDNRVYEYLSLAEAYRDEGGKTRHRVLLRLGEASTLRDTGELDRIITVLKRHAAAEDQETVALEGLEAETRVGSDDSGGRLVGSARVG